MLRVCRNVHGESTDDDSEVMQTGCSFWRLCRNQITRQSSDLSPDWRRVIYRLQICELYSHWG